VTNSSRRRCKPGRTTTKLRIQLNNKVKMVHSRVDHPSLFSLSQSNNQKLFLLVEGHCHYESNLLYVDWFDWFEWWILLEQSKSSQLLLVT
jgi:hypothetical protein